MSADDLKNEIKEKYSLTGMEVDDIMRYVRALCSEFEKLARGFKSEHLIELQNHQSKSKQNKAEKNVFLKTGKGVFNRLSSPAKELKKQFFQTKKARELVLAALKAHTVSGDPKSVITEILSLMAQHYQFSNDERVITGRRAFESLSDTGIEA